MMDGPAQGRTMVRRTMVAAAVAMNADADTNPADVDTDKSGVRRARAQQGYGQYGGNQSFHRLVFRGLHSRHRRYPA